MEKGLAKHPAQQEDIERKATFLMIWMNSVWLTIIPLMMAGLYKAFSFSSALDVLGLLLLVNGIGFVIHTARTNWAESQTMLKRKKRRAGS